MDSDSKALLLAWLSANRAYREHQGHCKECQDQPDIVGCAVAYQLYEVREAARLARDEAK